MNDFDFEIRQKKILARGAKYKKNGSKSKNCSLPSDFLTRAQIRKLNGEVISMNVNKPMSWEAFKALPQSMGQEYIRYLQEQYDARPRNIAQMFRVGQVTFQSYCKAKGIACISKKGHLQAKKKQAWELFLIAGAEPPAAAPAVADTPKPDSRPVEVERLTVDMTAELAALAEYIKILPFTGRCRMVLTLEKVEGTP